MNCHFGGFTPYFKKYLMGTLVLIVLSYVIVDCSATGSGDGVLMRVYEDDISVQNHWEAILHCALSYPNLVHENCTRMWWSHEIDTRTHVEENPEEDDETYKIKTELPKQTTHLEILAFSERVKGAYKCQAECGSHIYAITCEVQDVPNENRSTLCSEKKFLPDPTSGGHGSHSETNTPLLLGMTVGTAILGSVLLTGLIRWFNKRREAQKRYRQAVMDLSRPSGPLPPLRPTQRCPRDPNIVPANVPRQEFPVTNVSLPPMPPTLFFNRTGQTPDQVVYQQMPDGSQIVFIPASKLPSYEASEADTQTGASPTEAQTRRHHMQSHGLTNALQGDSPLSQMMRNENPSVFCGHGRNTDSHHRTRENQDSPQRRRENQDSHHRARKNRNSHHSHHRAHQSVSQAQERVEGACVASEVSDSVSDNGSYKSLPPSYGSLYGVMESEHSDTSNNGDFITSCSGSDKVNDDSASVESEDSEVEESSDIHPSHEPLLSSHDALEQNTCPNDSRLPRWMVGYPPPDYTD